MGFRTAAPTHLPSPSKALGEGKGGVGAVALGPGSPLRQQRGPGARANETSQPQVSRCPQDPSDWRCGTGNMLRGIGGATA